jgi:long-chain fatty acid transport protein
MKKALVIIAVGLSLFGITRHADALGFRTPQQGAKSAGMGGAFVATADDPAAIWYNPAGLTQLEGLHFYHGAYNTLIQTDVALASGATAKTKDRIASLPQLYLVSDLNTKKWRVGFGVNMPFGEKIEWGNNVQFRTAVTDAELRVLNFNPCVAYQITPNLSVGAGFDYYLSDTEQERGLAPFAFFGGVDKFRFEGNGGGAGYNFGALWRINDQHSLGLSYRSKIQVNYEGEVKLTAPPTFVPVTAPAEVGINFPQIIMVGYAFRPTPQLLLEVGVDWTGWEQLNSFDLRSPLISNSSPLHWESSFIYEFGGEYKLNDAWAVRAGYIFSENSVPDATFSPVLPDSDRHVVTLGLGYVRKDWTFNFAYQYAFTPDRVVTGTSFAFPPFPPTSANGSYNTDVHGLTFSASKKF